MEAWQVGLVVMMAVGVGVILAGALADRTRRRARERALVSPPERLGMPDVRPAYVGVDELAATPPPASDDVDLTCAETVVAPSAAGDRLVVIGTRVLLCPDTVGTVRELMGVVARHDPLVVAAAGFDAEVVATLEANRRRGLHHVVPVVADADAAGRIAGLTGARPLTRRDLQSGWHPDAHLGRAATWVADADGSRVCSTQD
ncbi:hypothetical protein GCM10027418_08230 [Mariniluteicoccus endophyticus]